jgi:CAAX prenyl protease-like protein
LNTAIAGTREPVRARASAVEYVAPLAVYGVLTTIEGYISPTLYPAAYIAKACALTVTLLACRRTFDDIRPAWKDVPLAIVVGVAVFVEWVAIDNWLPYPHLGTRGGFDPFGNISSPVYLAVFLSARFCGLILLVPVMEELFLRSFLARYATALDWQELPIGTFSQRAFGIVIVFASAAHPEWVVAVVANVGFLFLLWRTKSLFSTITAHAVANAALGAYIVYTGAWRFW